LLHVVGALHPSSGFAGRLNSGKQQANHHPNNCNDNQQLDKSKALSSPIKRSHFHAPKSKKVNNLKRGFKAVT
jgi:hypothetical protein